ncbi:MAG: TIGR00282 family metallophosphoesterase [Clostridia bacterium]|nr:TIGR00282 family metallophosphoesterase [Clostridia bacterium]
MRVLFVGDVTGTVGIQTACNGIAKIKKDRKIDFIIVNGENAANKNGITEGIYRELRFGGADVVTLGNHSFDRDEIQDFIREEECLIRPYNYPKNTPGNGYVVCDMGREKVAVISLMGNVYLSTLTSPFEVIDELLAEIKAQECKTIIIDLHGEATSEKIAFGHYVDGKVSAVIGTHTHVQTADEKILPKGTGYITDCGMTGPYESVLGVTTSLAVERFCTQLPVRFEHAQGVGQFNGVLLEIEDGKTQKIERVNFVEKDRKKG